MEKPIVVMSLKDVLVSSEPWESAHELWFDIMAKRLDDPSILSWAHREDYFKGVDIVMQRVFPELSEKERTVKARAFYFDAVGMYIRLYPKVRNDALIDYFYSMKKYVQFALITTNTLDAVNRILSILGVMDLFDIIQVSLPEEKDDKLIVCSRFLEQHGLPTLCVAREGSQLVDFFSSHHVSCVLPDVDAVDTVLESVIHHH